MLVEAMAEIAVQTVVEIVAAVGDVEVVDGAVAVDVTEAAVVVVTAVAMAGTGAGVVVGIKTSSHGFRG